MGGEIEFWLASKRTYCSNGSEAFVAPEVGFVAYFASNFDANFRISQGPTDVNVHSACPSHGLK